MARSYKRGSQSLILRVFIQDNTSTKGAGLAGLTSASTNLQIGMVRELGGTPITIYTGANIEAVTTIGTYGAPSTSAKIKFKAVDGTNAPGLYEIQIHDSATNGFGAGDASKYVTMYIWEITTTALNIAPLVAEFPLEAHDVQDGVRLGLTALPNAAAEAAGGLYTRGVGAGQITQDANGRIDVNLKAIDAGATAGNNATLNLKQLNIVNNAGDALVASSTGGNGQGVNASGNGTGHGIKALSGAGATGDGINASAASTNGQGLSATGTGTGHGVKALSGTGVTGDGISAASQATNGRGIAAIGVGSGAGMLSTGGATGHGISALGGATSGDGISAAAATSGHGITATGVGTTKHGVNAAGGATSSDGIRAVGGGIGHGINATSGGGATGDGISALAASTNGRGIVGTGTGTGDGVRAVAGATGAGLAATATAGAGISATGAGANAGILATGGSGGDGIKAAGTGAGHGLNAVAGATNANGITATGGGTGHGIAAASGAGATGNGINASSGATAGTGLAATGAGTGHGVLATGGATGHGVYGLSGAGATGQGIRAEAQSTNDSGLVGVGKGTGNGVLATGGAGAAGDGIEAVAGGGVPIRGDLTGNITGNVSGSVGSVTGGATAAALATVQADTDDIQTRLPAALVGGRIDASVGAVAANAITAASIADAAIDNATFAADTGLQSFRSNTAQAGAAGSITLDAGASATTDFYVGAWIVLTGLTGAGQARVCTAYNGGTKVATIAPNWATNPDATTTFAILPAAQVTGVQGNVTGSVGSVTGAVGSVTGAVGSVTGSVGSVTGAVGSVTGAVGSVTGNVNGDIVGDVQKKVLGGGASALSGVGVQADVEQWKTAVPNALIAGRIDANAQALANAIIAAATFAAGAIDDNAIAAAGANKIADHAIRRSFANAKASANGDAKSFRSLLGAIAKLVNKISIAGTTLTITEDDDATSLGSQTLTTDATANPITAADTV